MRNLLLAVSAAGAMAVATSAYGQAEVFVDESTCGVLDANLVGTSILHAALGGDGLMQAVITPNGDTKLTCSGTMPEGAAIPDDRAMLLDFATTDLKCRKPGGDGTTEWHEVITPSGKVTLTCFFRD